jgi:hypothetical protein
MFHFQIEISRSEQYGGDVRVGCGSLAVGSQIMDTAQAWVFDESSYDMHCLVLFAILLVEQGDCNVVSSAQFGILKGEHFPIFEETDTTQQESLGFLAVAAGVVEVFAASETEEKGRDHNRY